MEKAEPTELLNDLWDFGLTKHFGPDYRKPPEVLYHYTTLQGLMGVVRSNRIWATNTRYLNDINESRQLWIFLERRLQAMVASGMQFPAVDLTALISLIRRPVNQDTFVASFSEARDSLSQWRAYSSGGSGICIGFSGEALNTAWVHNPSGESHWTGMQFQKVRYLQDSDPEFDPALKSLLMGTRLPLMEATNSQLSKEEELVLMLSIFQSQFKHYAFREELEWRLSFRRFHKPMRHQQFRTSRTMLIPYIEAELNKSMQETQMVEGEYIREVIVGPSAHAELNKQAVEQFLHSLDRTAIPVGLSATPYRDW